MTQNPRAEGGDRKGDVGPDLRSPRSGLPKRPSIDSVTTINDDGSRYFVHPADVRGPWTTGRRLVAVVLMAVYVSLPFIPINGAPAVFLDVAHRKFHLFGLTLMFQDLWLLFFLITGLGFTLFLITAIVGRIWCGWACPQTVFLDHIIRRIERVIDGDAVARRKLEDAPLTAGKAIRRVVKHVLFFVFAALIAHLFMAYFVSVPELYRMAHRSPLENWGTFLFVFGMTSALYFDFAWFREQFCIILCPYGRLQSALIDDNSIVIGYDEKRGEPRGKTGTGDCIDCRRCVQVCPTGIDIRQGLQLECIGCEACIDACDEVMVRLDRKKGLIRHDSLNALAGRASKFLRPRLFLYLFFALAGATVFAFATTQVKPVILSVLRMQGSPYIRDESVIRNNFYLRLSNKRGSEHTYKIELVSPQAGLQATGATSAPVTLGPREEIQEPLILTVPDKDFHGQFDVEVNVVGESGRVETSRKIPFLGPFRE
ncbi:MAG: cytochrome c oxidase accessory protein CcoG [Terrimicrobiaceae bacterium]|nr:cytochrome c oxidase accessory protein CcoG [Terrimicrobiaceae bacterium]